LQDGALADPPSRAAVADLLGALFDTPGAAGGAAGPPAPSWRTAANPGAAISSSYLRSSAERRYLLNKYRVLLSRSRESLIIWCPQATLMIPRGNPLASIEWQLFSSAPASTRSARNGRTRHSGVLDQ